MRTVPKRERFLNLLSETASCFCWFSDILFKEHITSLQLKDLDKIFGSSRTADYV